MNATNTLAIIGQSETRHGLLRAAPQAVGTAAAVGETELTNTRTGWITVGKPVVVYGKKGMMNPETEDVVEF